jgi:hypothetical protein
MYDEKRGEKKGENEWKQKGVEILGDVLGCFVYNVQYLFDVCMYIFCTVMRWQWVVLSYGDSGSMPDLSDEITSRIFHQIAHQERI